MPSPRNRRHIIVPTPPSVEAYRPHGRPISAPKFPAPADRVAHGQALKQAMETAAAQGIQRREAEPIQVHGAVPRLNQRALEKGESKPSTGGGSSDWYLGEQARNHGSLHSDLCVDMTAADLAERGVIGLYPVSGWWKEQSKRDRSDHGARYALVVSIETDAAEVDIWTPVAVKVGVPIEVTS